MNDVSSSEPRTLQLVDGALAILRGLRFLVRTPASWPFAALPMVVCAVLWALSIGGAIHFVPRLMAAAWPGLDETLGNVGTWIARFFAIALSAVVGMAIALFATPP